MYRKQIVVDNVYNKIHLSEGVVYAEYKPSVRVTLDVAKQVVEDRLLVCSGVSYPVCGDISNLVKVDNDAREYLGSEEACRLITRLAVITNNPIQKLLGNFYLRFKKSDIPTRLFTNKKKAVYWLKNANSLN